VKRLWILVLASGCGRSEGVPSRERGTPADAFAIANSAAEHGDDATVWRYLSAGAQQWWRERCELTARAWRDDPRTARRMAAAGIPDPGEMAADAYATLRFRHLLRNRVARFELVEVEPDGESRATVRLRVREPERTFLREVRLVREDGGWRFDEVVW
jgi:hypothetical protein